MSGTAGRKDSRKTGLVNKCGCIRYWKQDDQLESPHCMIPVTCEAYIQELVDVLTRWVDISDSGTDSILVVKTHELLEARGREV
jgi:hypothetical protein